MQENDCYKVEYGYFRAFTFLKIPEPNLYLAR